MEYQTRFIPGRDAAELINLYHLGRTALSGQDDSPYARMQWAAKQFCTAHDDIKPGGAYKDLCGLLGR